MTDNQTILRTRLDAFNLRAGARVGDYLKLTPPDPRCPDHTRFTHDWGDHLQTGGHVYGQYYFGGAWLSYSGGLDPGIAVVDLIPTAETKPGAVWFFALDISGARRGVDFMVPMRVFIPRPGADLGGIGELRCPYYLGVWTEQQARERGHDYRFTITKHAIAQTAFHSEEELRAWLAQERLALTADLQTSQSLAWP